MKQKKINEIVFREELSEITTEHKKTTSDGHILETEYTHVRGFNLKEVKQIHDKLRDKK